MVAGHVGLDISCLDRLYLNGYVNKLQTPGGVVYFFHDRRGKPIVSRPGGRLAGRIREADPGGHTKVYDHILHPLMAPDRPNAPPELTAATDTLDKITVSHIAQARVPTAA
jgi:hypothetical protein